MAGKARVHEIAKDLGVESKVVLAKLAEIGEYVKSASSTIEAPVARRFRAAMEASGVAPAAAGAPATAPSPAGGAAPPPELIFLSSRGMQRGAICRATSQRQYRRTWRAIRD